jgi:hypothetical protein
MDWRFKGRQEKLRSRAGKSMQELRVSEVLRAMRRIFVRPFAGGGDEVAAFVFVDG